MEGPFQLDENVIDLIVTQAAPAVYLIRRIEETEAYAHYIARIERADAGALKNELKKMDWRRLPRFLFRVCGR